MELFWELDLAWYSKTLQIEKWTAMMAQLMNTKMLEWTKYAWQSGKRHPCNYAKAKSESIFKNAAKYVLQLQLYTCDSENNVQWL